MVRDIFITRIFNKRQLMKEKTKDIQKKDNLSFTITLNKYNASLIVVTLAYAIRQLYYGKVEEIKFEDFYKNEDFGEVFYQLRIILLYLNELCKTNFKDYQDYKILK